MATRRMISKNITQTQRFLQMPLEAQALYFHLIQSADDDGIVEAFPVVRMIGSSEDSLGLLVVKKFVRPLNDEMVYFVIDFHEQNLVRKDRYTPSRYQELLSAGEMADNPRISVISEGENKRLTDGQPNDNQWLTDGHPSIGKGSIVKDSIGKGRGVEVEKELPTTPTPIHSQDFVTLYQVFEQETGRPLSPIQQQELGYMLQDFSPDLIQEALREAVSQGKANFAYIKAILNRWKSDNLLTVDLVRNSKRLRTKSEESKQPMSYEDWQPTAENPF